MKLGELKKEKRRACRETTRPSLMRTRVIFFDPRPEIATKVQKQNPIRRLIDYFLACKMIALS